jgi:lipid A ethanolaminephosphotransferase
MGFFSFSTMLFLIWTCFGKFSKWVLTTFLVTSAFAAYYMDQFGVVIDRDMIANMMETNPQEFAGLVSIKLVVHVLLIGIIPSMLVFKFAPMSTSFGSGLKVRLRLTALLIVLCILSISLFTADFASFVREHKITRMYANPLGFTYSLISYGKTQFKRQPVYVLKHTAADAKKLFHIGNKKLIILVVGETARSDRFSLNGYNKETTPELKKLNVVSFKNVTSCGTATKISLPCMFSNLGRSNYDENQAFQQENALDVLSEYGVKVLWRENNSDSKGVATRIPYQYFKSPTLNPVCDEECRDIGMLSGLDQYIKSHEGKDILIVLHQMGNHGPEYYRRYPENFRRFQPMCMTGELGDCTKQEVDNAYDNAILYTDYFLANVIKFLKRYDETYSTAMLYVADHGESLGERGIYLHAAPYVIAPKVQTHIPVIIWTGKYFDYQIEDIQPWQDFPFSHDDLFCTLLIANDIYSNKTCGSKKTWFLKNKNLKFKDTK